MDTYSKSQLYDMNLNYKYGPGWIKINQNANSNINTNISKDNYKLYATGDSNISSGRIYIALPASEIITEELKRKYNIM